MRPINETGLGKLTGFKMKKDFWQGKKILITGGKGFVGSWVVKNLIKNCGVDKEKIRITDSTKEDLRLFASAQKAVKKINIIIHLAADVGGVGYSSVYPATQLRNCLLIDANIFEAAAREKVEKIIAVSSSVAYSPHSPSPLAEKNFFDGVPAKTNLGYGFAKRTTAVLGQSYWQEKNLKSVILIPNNAYGPGQDFSLVTGHVIPSLIYKCLTFKNLEVWGNGKAVRDFLYVEDFTQGILKAAEKINKPNPINLGTGKGTSIKDLVKMIVRLTDFKGKIIYDKTKPSGQAQRIVNINKARKLLGFKPKWTLEKGLAKTINWIKEQI